MSLLIQVLLMSFQAQKPSYNDCGYIVTDPAPPVSREVPTSAKRQRAAAKRLLCARTHFPDRLPELLDADPEMAAVDPDFVRRVQADEDIRMIAVRAELAADVSPSSAGLTGKLTSYPGVLPQDGYERSVFATYLVQPTGRVTDCTIEKSSGLPAVDTWICEVVTRERHEPSSYSRIREGQVSWGTREVLTVIVK